ncbi:DUF3540 domain-containing protein [Rhizobium mayense]|uniref:DUF3540 domain-containing protein n=1 Tax=Rhizobium mayense TaxID=1312184 RepID=A0ABT7JR70_9HYPH|nr:DUF3540 domain-containing protein [Rhizobium mayense]MDL2398845.1 DUF3540 domain-containing protein [Rhizobium mayense]
MTGPMTSRSTAQHAAAKLQPVAAANGLLRGTVKTLMTATEAGVETDEGESVLARQAASCLLAPAIGDRVLLCMIGSETYVLAVLERESQHAAEISVPGARKVTISAGQTLELNAPSMNLAARQLTLLARNMAHTGQFLTSNFKTIVETVIDKTIGARSLTTKADVRTAVITEVEMLNAGTLVQNIDTVATQNSEIALVTAQRDVRLDAERVSVG